MRYEGKTVSDRRTDGRTDKVMYRGACYAPENSILYWDKKKKNRRLFPFKPSIKLEAGKYNYRGINSTVYGCPHRL